MDLDCKAVLVLAEEDLFLNYGIVALVLLLDQHVELNAGVVIVGEAMLDE